MEKVYEFLKDAKVFYFATVDGDRPRMRPFGVVFVYEGKLYVQTGKVKEVSKQLGVNPNAEICVFHKGTWLRLWGTLVEDDRPEPQQVFCDSYPNLTDRYAVGDGNLQVLCFENAIAEFYAPGKDVEIIRF